MLRSLRNIESNIGGLTNLLIRTGVGKDFNIAEGFKMNGIGKALANPTVGALGGLLGGGALGGLFGNFSYCRTYRFSCRCAHRSDTR